MLVLIVVMILGLPALSQAAYTQAEVVSNDVQVDGKTLIVLDVVGDADEPRIQLKYTVPANPTMAELRYTVAEKIAALNLARTVATLPAVRPGARITPLARPAPSALTAKQIWQEKTNLLTRYLDLQAKGVTAINSAVTALLADINATYQAGYAD